MLFNAFFPIVARASWCPQENKKAFLSSELCINLSSGSKMNQWLLNVSLSGLNRNFIRREVQRFNNKQCLLQWNAYWQVEANAGTTVKYVIAWQRLSTSAVYTVETLQKLMSDVWLTLCIIPISCSFRLSFVWSMKTWRSSLSWTKN